MSASAYVDLYKRYTDYCHGLGLNPTVGNPGGDEQSAWFSTYTADVIVVHENSSWPSEASMEGNFAGGHAFYSPERRGALVYKQPTLDTGLLDTFTQECSMGLRNSRRSSQSRLGHVTNISRSDCSAHGRGRRREEPTIAARGTTAQYWRGDKTFRRSTRPQSGSATSTTRPTPTSRSVRRGQRRTHSRQAATSSSPRCIEGRQGRRYHGW